MRFALLLLVLAACDPEVTSPPAPELPLGCTKDSDTEIKLFVRFYRDGAELSCADAFPGGAPALTVIDYDGAHELAPMLCDSHVLAWLGQTGSGGYTYRHVGPYPHEVSLDGRIFHTVYVEGSACDLGFMNWSISVDLGASPPAGE